MQPRVNIFWFRRDLRLEDNAGLYHALKGELPVLPIFIFDRDILDDLDKDDRRVHFIHQAVSALQEKLTALGSTLEVRYGFPAEVFRTLLKEYTVETVFTNHDYEPYARERDKEISEQLSVAGVFFKTYKDQVLLERSEVVKDNGEPYTIFTPYYRKWSETINAFYFKSYPVNKYHRQFFQQKAKPIPSLKSMHFDQPEGSFPLEEINAALIRGYDQTRDIPSIAGTSRLGVHLRFGTISIRRLATVAKKMNPVFLKELGWREFYQMILWHFPRVIKESFRPEYDKIRWRNNEQEFKAWCEGQTGYPIVDAGMRELNETGFMHNRVRMITASFLTKHLLIDWRWGEAYFAEKLLDYELASNNGGWQWAAGTGCDSAPYFRIFNPYLQTKKFDPDLKYIQRWVPEFQEFFYPVPIVEHDFARKRALEVYAQALRK